MMEVTTILTSELVRAWNNWRSYFGDKSDYTAFQDFVDPVRQSDVGTLFFKDDTESMEVPVQIANRVKALSGPHFYAVLKANEDRVEQAHTSWGKKLPWKDSQ